MATTVKPSKPRRARRWIIRIVVLLVLVIVAAIAMGPWIASRLAPGIIESAAAENIQGTVKVDRVSMGWFSPAAAGPIQLLDPQGQTVATVSVDTPVTLWRAISGRWWSATALDLGTITVRGDVDLIRKPDGSTNLDAAIAPRGGSAPTSPGGKGSGGGGGGSSVPDIKARLQIAQLDATIREQHADGTFGPRLGVQKLSGPIDVALDQGSLAAKADLKADVVANGGGSQAVIALDASAKQRTAKGPSGFDPANIERAVVTLDATGIPTSLIDALGGFGGALEEGLGAASDTSVRIDGNLDAAAVAVTFVSPGASASSSLRIVDGMLVQGEAGKPAASISLKSTGFVARLPQAEGAIRAARQSLELDSGPAVSVMVDSLRLPIPAGIASGKKLDAAGLDFRGSGAKVTVDVGAMQGRVSLPAAGAAKGDGAATAKDQKPFAAEALRIVVDATDLAKPVSVVGGTKATLDGRSAGDLAINASADGLLDAQGRVRALQQGAPPIGSVSADVSVKQLATALIQPFVSAMSLPIDMAQDVGPTLDVTASVHSDAGAKPAAGAAGISALPPTTALISVDSSNLSARVPARLEAGTLRTTGEGIRVSMNSATPLARRVLAGDGKSAPAASIDGRSAVEIRLTDVVASLEQLTGEGAKAPLAAVDGKLSVSVTDVRATVAPIPVSEGAAAITAAPLEIPQAVLGVVLARGQAPVVNLEARAATAGTAAPMNLAATLAAEGLKSGALPSGGGLDALLAMKLTGEIKASGVPPALLGAVPQLARYAPGTSGRGGSELDHAVAEAIAGAIGSGAEATILLGQPQGGGVGQIVRVQVATQAQGVGTDIALRVTPTEAAITRGTSFLVAEPRTVNAILAAAGKPAPGAAAEPAAEGTVAAAPSRPITLEQRTKVWLKMPEAIVVPLKRNAEEGVLPDFAKAKDFFATLAAEGEIVVGGIPVGSTPGATPEAPPVTTYATARLGKLEAQARVPMAALENDAAAKNPANRASLKLTTDARTGESGGQIAAVSVDAKAGMDGTSPEAVVTLADINTGNVDALLKRDGMVTGALGNKADITLRVTPDRAAGDLTIVAEATSPTISGASLSLVKRGETVGLSAPSNITWTPAPAFLNSLLVKGEESVRVTRTTPVTINLTKLAIATGPEGSGPLKPGVFDLDAQLLTQQVGMDVPSPADSKGARPPARAVTMNGISARARWDASAPAIRESGAGALSAAITIDGIAGTEGPAAKASKITATVRAIADPQGNLTPDKAVINAEADLNMFPTILIDELAGQGGLMAEALGPTVSASATLRNISQAKAGPRGSLEATVTSPRATAQVKGDLRRGQFIQNGPTQIRLVEIRPQLMEALAGSLPLVASMEKTTADEPAMVEAKDISVPLDKDLAKLNGVITVDLGVARFTTQSIFGSLLKAVGGRESGAIGRKVEPFVVRIENGVATYDRFRLPLGEFSIETRGTVDLVSKKVNLVAYVPFFALTDEAMGPIRLGLGGKLDVLDRTTMVPISIKGSMDKPSAMIDAPLFLQETGQNLLHAPGRVLEGIGDLLGGKKKEEPKPDK